MLITKYKWLGFAIGATAVIAGIVIGILAYEGILTTQEAYAIARWCLLIGFIGWALHMIVVLQQRKEKRRANKTETNN
jgi:hypothetical protein